MFFFAIQNILYIGKLTTKMITKIKTSQETLDISYKNHWIGISKNIFQQKYRVPFKVPMTNLLSLYETPCLRYLQSIKMIIIFTIIPL